MKVKGLLVSQNGEEVIPDDQFLLNILIESAKSFIAESCICRYETKKPVDECKRDYAVDASEDLLQVTCVVMWMVDSCRKDKWCRLEDGAWSEVDGMLYLNDEPRCDITPWGLRIEYAYMPEIDPCEMPEHLKDHRWSEGVIEYAMHYFYRMNASYAGINKREDAEERMEEIARHAFDRAGKFGGYPVATKADTNEVRSFLS